MSQTPDQSKPKSYDHDGFKTWFRRMYLLVIKECYEKRNYIDLRRVHENYQIIDAKFKAKDPLYRDKPSVQSRSKQGFLAQPRWQILGRMLLDGKDPTKRRTMDELISQANPEKPTVDDQRAADWFQKAPTIDYQDESDDFGANG